MWTREQRESDMILVTGIPRSGTSWTARILSRTKRTDLYYEPDNEHNNLLGFMHKSDLPRFPYLSGEEPVNGLHRIYRSVLEGRYLPGYCRLSIVIKKALGINLESVERQIRRKERLMRAGGPTLSGNRSIVQKTRLALVRRLFAAALLLRRQPPRDHAVLVKSVHSVLALSYLDRHFGPRILIVLRHPANIISSHLRVGNPDLRRNLFGQPRLAEDHIAPFWEAFRSLDTPLARAGAQVGAIYYVLSRQLQRHPRWMIVTHESLCRDPLSGFYRLHRKLDLPWTKRVRRKIEELNQRGSGYTNKRIASEQIHKWKRELDRESIAKIRRGFGLFPSSFYPNFGGSSKTS